MVFGRRAQGPIVDIDLPLDIQAAQRLAFWMDNAIEIPFLKRRIGWDAVAGLVPGAGDIAMALVGVYMIWIGWRYQLPTRVLVHMAFNLLFDAVSGSIPVVGDLFDATFKAHARNAQLLVEAYRNQLAPGQVTLNLSPQSPAAGETPGAYSTQRLAIPTKKCYNNNMLSHCLHSGQIQSSRVNLLT